MKKILIIIGISLFLSQAFAQMQRSYKRGVGENNFNHKEEIEALAPGVSWFYNWGTNPLRQVADIVRPGGVMEFVPMAWNGNFSEQAIRDSLEKYPGTKYLLGFNEPNFKAQANMTPEQAAERWPVLESIARDYNLQLVAPALNFPDGPINDGVTYQPKDWLNGFINAYKEQNDGREPQIDFIALHCYMNSPTAQNGFIKDFEKTFHKKIWLTEFCAWEGQVDSVYQLQTMVQKIQDLELDSMVYRYAWFKAKGTASNPYYRLLINQNLLTHQPAWGTLSNMGKVYVHMSSFDTTYYHKVNTQIAAKDYVNSMGVTLEVNTDAASEQIIQIGSFDSNSWCEYLVDIPTAGEYTVKFRLASERFLFDPKIRVLVNGVKLAEAVFPETGSDDVWKTFELKVPFEAGKQRIRVLSGQSTTCKVNWLEIVDNSHVYGDINGDKVVDVKDLTALINMVLGVIPTDLTVADLNDDGDVNVQDVTRLIAIIIGD